MSIYRRENVERKRGHYVFHLGKVRCRHLALAKQVLTGEVAGHKLKNGKAQGMSVSFLETLLLVDHLQVCHLRGYGSNPSGVQASSSGQRHETQGPGTASTILEADS